MFSRSEAMSGNVDDSAQRELPYRTGQIVVVIKVPCIASVVTSNNRQSLCITESAKCLK